MTRAADTGLMRRLLLALCALALLSGCGGGVDASLLATAVRNTEAAGGAEIAMRMEMDMPGMDQPYVVTGSGVEDTKGRRAHFKMESVPGLGELEAVSEGFTMYMRSELFGKAFGKDWMKLDLERTSKAMGLDLGSMGQMGQGTSEQLRMLGQVSDGVKDEGRETVVGVEATHYSATVDLRKYPGQNVDKLIELTGESEFPMDVWIDDEQRVRRLEWEQTLRQGGVEAHMKAIAEYVRFGVPVDIDIPDADDVFDATDLAINGLNQQLN
jgi:hypothetical protein